MVVSDRLVRVSAGPDIRHGIIARESRGKRCLENEGENRQVFMLLQRGRKNTGWVCIIRTSGSGSTGLDGDMILSESGGAVIFRELHKNGDESRDHFQV